MAADGYTDRLPFPIETLGVHGADTDTDTDTDAGLAIEVAAATLAGLPGATPTRLHALLKRFGTATHALDAVLDGRAAEAFLDDHRCEVLARHWARCADPITVALTLRRRATRVWATGQRDFPIDPRLPLAPAVLLAEGDRPEVLDRPRVAVVGTRAASPPGIADARAIGRYLAEQGITVVSGLAIGIDAAAHEGALEVGGGAIGVVATGLDIVYPRRHGRLFAGVRRHGLVLGEHGFGVPPTKARFPIRNRIIAALCDATVVVEATATGGARITADLALRYDREVLAMPGSRRNPAAAGCNALIADGAHALLDPSDVLTVLGRHAPASAYAASIAQTAPADRKQRRKVGWDGSTEGLSPAARRLHASMSGEPATLDQLVGRTGLAVGEVAGLIRELERSGRLERARGLLWPC
jgi:DNA processing protein